MNSITFDKLAYLEALKAGGFDDKQSHAADALDQALRETVATKADIKELEHRLVELELRLRHDLTVRLGAMMVATVAILTALIKFL